jgi:hypothetical protein
MKTLYLYGLYKKPEPGKYFVIGVKESGYEDEDEEGDLDESSLEEFQRKFPEAKIERFPEVYNPKYIHSNYRDSHILQPAFVTFL